MIGFLLGLLGLIVVIVISLALGFCFGVYTKLHEIEGDLTEAEKEEIIEIIFDKH